MANIKELKKRIKSTKSTLKITSAMKLVSAAKLSKAQAKIVGIKSYSNELSQTLKIATSLNEDYSHYLLKENDTDKSAVFIISSNKGLCGGYNSQLFKHVKNKISKNEDIFTIGRKAKELLKREGFEIKKHFTFQGNEPTYEEISSLTSFIETLYKDGVYKSVSIIYNSFVSALEFNTKHEKLLPISLSEEEKNETKAKYPFDFIYEKDYVDILDSIVPESFNITFYTCLMDAIAAEHGSRMTAMDNATNNSKDMIKNLNLKANKLRQAAITTELTEIVSGAESLK